MRNVQVCRTVRERCADTRALIVRARARRDTETLRVAPYLSKPKSIPEEKRNSAVCSPINTRRRSAVPSFRRIFTECQPECFSPHLLSGRCARAIEMPSSLLPFERRARPLNCGEVFAEEEIPVLCFEPFPQRVVQGSRKSERANSRRFLRSVNFRY